MDADLHVHFWKATHGKEVTPVQNQRTNTSENFREVFPHDFYSEQMSPQNHTDKSLKHLKMGLMLLGSSAFHDSYFFGHMSFEMYAQGFRYSG